jgi:hypothetical protein
MYPQHGWRQLPDDHWAYRAHSPVQGRRPVLRGISNGVRELIILAPGGELTAMFQRNDTKQTGAFTTAANIYFHASEMNRARPRLGRHVPPTASNMQPQINATVVRALHAGNWKPEPLALEQFTMSAAATCGMQIRISDHPLSRIDQISPAPDLVIASGIDAHAFSEAELGAVRKYTANGGMILFETPGGTGEFTASAERAIEQLLERPVESVLRSPIITGEGMKNAVNLTQIEYRPFTLQSFGARETAPRLRGITFDEKRGPQALFSREDITHALLDQPCWGISGYAPQSARDLLANILQHAVATKGDDEN